MANITRQQAYETGVPLIDDQNRGLVDVIGKLEMVTHSRQAEAGVHEALVSLVNHIRYHFSAEEQFMAENEYSHIDSHADMHLEFIKEVAAFIKRLKTNRSVPASDILSFLKRWLITHIMREDTKLTQCRQTVILSKMS